MLWDSHKGTVSHVSQDHFSLALARYLHKERTWLVLSLWVVANQMFDVSWLGLRYSDVLHNFQLYSSQIS